MDERGALAAVKTACGYAWNGKKGANCDNLSMSALFQSFIPEPFRRCGGENGKRAGAGSKFVGAHAKKYPRRFGRRWF
ncbi:hypothetical protein CCR94_14150 [Rhodoblastus sphagnicola]|uniref:Uncharacterized protein n=1 Tax=Rhodoblastus sphagnicola TaxID=333368 RepID=A0A2S6N5A5_9HYPH|nr:hypothetical protein CCR94_14150 [Rhodoblastus sphagnicola]